MFQLQNNDYICVYFVKRTFKKIPQLVLRLSFYNTKCLKLGYKLQSNFINEVSIIQTIT